MATLENQKLEIQQKIKSQKYKKENNSIIERIMNKGFFEKLLRNIESDL